LYLRRDGFVYQSGFKNGNRNFQPLKEFRGRADANRQNLFGLAASRLVEDVLAGFA